MFLLVNKIPFNYNTFDCFFQFFLIQRIKNGQNLKASHKTQKEPQPFLKSGLRFLDLKLLFHYGSELIARNFFLFKQNLGNGVQLRHSIIQKLQCLCILFHYDCLDLLIDCGGSLLRIVRCGREITAQKYFVIIMTVGNQTESVAHAELGYHLSCKRGCALNIV